MLYIKPKKLAIIGAVALVICIVAGCTSPTTSPNASTTGAAGTASTNPTNATADLMTQAAKDKGYNVTTPFVQTTINNFTAYKGVIDDGPKKLDPYRNNITILLVPDRATAMKEFNAAVTKAKAGGYVAWNTDSTAWSGNLGDEYASYPVPTVDIQAQEPSSGINPRATDVYLELGNYSAFSVTTNYQTAIS